MKSKQSNATPQREGDSRVHRWPEPLEPAALHGVAGQFVRTIEPESEADPAALLVDFLVKFGNLIGGGPHFRVEATRHPLILFALMVGPTSAGRKGTAEGHARSFFKRLQRIAERARSGGARAIVKPEQTIAQLNMQSGLSSAEGLIFAMRDPTELPDGKVLDEGVTDKRLCIVESEFSSVLRRMERQDNTLSSILRDAWDGKDLQTITRNSPLTATQPHISLVAHSTADELRRYLRHTEQVNGFINRFLLTAVRRSKELPEGGHLADDALEPLVVEVGEISTAILDIGDVEVWRDHAARELWADVYHDLTKDTPGLVGATIARAAPIVMRLACLYGLLDCSFEVGVKHLEAALAVWRYCEQSARYIFGDSLGDPLADRILRELRTSPEGLTRTNINDLLQHNESEDRIAAALDLLEKCELACRDKDASGKGRPVERWVAS